MEEWSKRFLSAAIIVCLLSAMILISRQIPVFAGRKGQGNNPLCVVLDAGHGGDDPGKLGVAGTPEKEINLTIAQKVKEYLEQQDVRVIMTREKDEMLSNGDGGGRKASDMKHRVEIINQSQADLTVSIHQNSYPSEKVKGAQVFYYKDSEESRILAEKLQESLREKVDPANHRQTKANTNYYLLKKTTLPTAIVECGFLSCPEEEQKLLEEAYQDRLAWAIANGILLYWNGEH